MKKVTEKILSKLMKWLDISKIMLKEIESEILICGGKISDLIYLVTIIIIFGYLESSYLDFKSN